MNKILKNYTIIPASLYISRSADRQLRTIIDDMGRPGYVLVSRQMGKTNLMLNAKRNLEDENVLFVYVDLSNQFEDSRDCFRNIINIAINTHHDKFLDLSSVIQASRSNDLAQPSNTEHEAELLKLLRFYKGKIVIILDEIDALTSSSYSDQIFAQIRSVYFAGRTNYCSEFSRLTYILSGVAEPSSIIKDKNKSPFNIGEKIYLDDFTYDEFVSFISKLDVKFSVDLIDKIYEALNGHPRMTWDVCSKLEDIYLETGRLTCDDVNNTIHLLYTKNFDHAPIDHIRDLVKNNFEIRKAVRKLLNFDYNLPDNIKSTLYLAGIIKSDFNTNGIIKIKNKIIASCISTEWLDSIDVMNKSYFNLASEQHLIGNYNEAIRYFNLYLDNYIEGDTTSKGIVLSLIADCYFALGDFDEALSYFLTSNEDRSTSQVILNRNLFKIGICYLNKTMFEESIKIFDNIRNKSKIEDSIKYQAAINYATVLLKLDYKNNVSNVLTVLTSIASDIISENLSDSDIIKDVLLLTYYYVANIYSTSGDTDLALDYYKKAVDIGDSKYQPYIYFCIIRCMSDRDSLILYLNKFCDVIINNNITIPDKVNVTYVSLDLMEISYDLLLQYLVLCYEYKCEYLASKLVNYYCNNINTDTSVIDTHRTILKTAISLKNYKSASGIADKLIKLLNKMESYDGYELQSLYKLLANIQYRSKIDYYYNISKYIDSFEKYNNYGHEIDYEDIITFVIAVVYLRTKKKYSDAIKVFKIISAYYESCPDNIKINFVSLFFFMARTYDELNNKILAIEYAKKTIDISVNYDAKSCRIVDIQQLEELRDFSNEIIRRRSKGEPILVGNKLGRNDLCFCGSGLKYKKCHGK